jgi:hypothetical protein
MKNLPSYFSIYARLGLNSFMKDAVKLLTSNVCYLNSKLNERQIFNLINLDSIFNYILNGSLEFRRLFTRTNETNKNKS